MENSFNKALRHLVKSTGMSVYELSRAIGMNYATLTSYCNQRAKPDFENLVKLADYFAVPLDYLAGRCSEEQAKIISENYSATFMDIRRAPYEAYLIGRKKLEGIISTGEAPWPYNLMDAVLEESWVEPLSKDQILGIESALSELTERERAFITKYFMDGETLEGIGSSFGLTRERTRQIIRDGIRSLRAPHRKAMMIYGLEELDRWRRLTQFKKKLEAEERGLAEIEQAIARRKKRLFDDAADASKVPTFDLEMSIAEMDLSVRSHNCLCRHGCKTLGDVFVVIESGNLMKIRNLGRKSAEEICNKIFSLTGRRYSVTDTKEVICIVPAGKEADSGWVESQ